MDIKNELKNYKTIKLSGKEVLFNQGSKCKYVGFVLKGELTISTITYNDREEVISIIHEGEWFGNMLIYLDNPVFLGDVIANRLSTVVLLNKNELNSLLQTNKEFLEYYLKQMSYKGQEIKAQNKILQHTNLKDRLLYFLKMYSKDNVYKFKSMTLLAKELAMPRESLSRLIKTLINDGSIEKINKAIIIKY